MPENSRQAKISERKEWERKDARPQGRKEDKSKSGFDFALRSYLRPCVLALK